MSDVRRHLPGVFLSYSHTDEVEAKHLRQLLASVLDDSRVWMDDKIPSSERWWRKILSEIEDRDRMVMLASAKAWESVYCRGELTEAWRIGRNVVVAKLGGAEVPDVIRREMQYVDLGKWTDDFTTSEAFAAIPSGLLLSTEAKPIPLSSLWSQRVSTVVDGGLLYRFSVPALVDPDHVGHHLCNTGVLVMPGDRIRIHATGNITFDYTQRPYNPDGYGLEEGTGNWIAYPSVRAYPTLATPVAGTRDSYIGSLMGWVGDGGPQNAFFVGRKFEWTFDGLVVGFLHLAVNDHPGEYGDNTGSFDVTIEHLRPTGSTP